MSVLRALVLRAPGINCDRETAQVCRLVGFETDLVHINQLIKAPDSLLDYQFLLIPGGFSYGDDLGAGTLLAKNLTIHLGDQLSRFISEGRPVLGICNGFQVLIRAGLLPGYPEARLRATLTENALAMFECRWISMAVQPGPCIFTRGIERPLEMPVAHGEGQFVLEDASLVDRLLANGQVPLVYTASDGNITQSVAYPANPNGSLSNIAGVCNARGNVLGLMPHPERFITMLQHPQRRSLAGRQADGLLIFKNAYEYTLQSLNNSPQKTQQNPSSDLSPENVGTPRGGGRNTQRAHGELGPYTRATVCPPGMNCRVDVEGIVDTTACTSASYADSGVDVAAGEKAVRLMKDAVRATQGPEVLAGIGAFAGVFSAKALQKMRRPVLVSSTDGVGTKTLIAAQAERYDTIGYDLLNHSINDLLMQGARPLFFMDYIAMGKLDPVHAATIVKGIANACRESGCALLGGETAEMPDVYLPGAFDLAGTIVGVAEEDEIVNGSTISAGDVILGLPSNGLHTNGYSLVRRVFAPYALDTVFPELGEPLVDALLQPHRSYLREITQLRDYLADRGRYIKGMAHITGGGFEGNISRILPPGMQAVVETNTWSVPPLFQLIGRLGKVPQAELYRALNMGIGVVMVLSPKSALEARCVLPELLTIGTIVEGEGVEKVFINIQGCEVASDDTNS
ncbi:MAG TPA: phosphoribosylformylglycinamidine cyclo-ligase [Ktedonobacteraceae bacterium]|jgi:phosphoribosylformylglycinamidine synthase I